MFIYRSAQGIVVILVLGVCKYHWVRIYACNIECNQTAKCKDSVQVVSAADVLNHDLGGLQANLSQK